MDTKHFRWLPFAAVRCDLSDTEQEDGGQARMLMTIAESWPGELQSALRDVLWAHYQMVLATVGDEYFDEVKDPDDVWNHVHAGSVTVLKVDDTGRLCVAWETTPGWEDEHGFLVLLADTGGEPMIVGIGEPGSHPINLIEEFLTDLDPALVTDESLGALKLGMSWDEVQAVTGFVKPRSGNGDGWFEYLRAGVTLIFGEPPNGIGYPHSADQQPRLRRFSVFPTIAKGVGRFTFGLTPIELALSGEQWKDSSAIGRVSKNEESFLLQFRYGRLAEVRFETRIDDGADATSEHKQ